jgi:flagellar protein FlaI
MTDNQVFRGIDIDSDTVGEALFTDATVEEVYDVSDYATVTILHSDRRDEYVYRVDEPTLGEFEKLIRKEVSKKVIDALKYTNSSQYSEEEMADVVEEQALNIIDNYVKPGSRFLNAVRDTLPLLSPSAEVLTEDSIERIVYYIVRDFAYYGKLTPVMNDEAVEDISCNAPNMPIFVYHGDYRDLMTNVAYTETGLDSFIRTLSQSVGKHISVSDPMVNGSLGDGSRIQMTLLDEVTGDGSNFTIRKFEDIPFTPIDLINYGTFSLEQMAYLWLAIENNKSLIFSGGTASGKTTSMNAISLFIPPGSKTITIEDTREITLRHNNWIKSMTRDAFGGDETGAVGMYDLLKAALRQRPEYLVVGEIRGEEAQTLFQAMSTGHTTYSTMHADSVEAAVHRLENPPIDVPRTMLQALDIICVQNQTFIGEERVRRNMVTAEITGMDAQTHSINTLDIYEWNPKSDTFGHPGESQVLDEIRTMRAWSQDQLNQQLAMREDVLEYMLENDIDKYEAVTDIIRSFILDVDGVHSLLEDGRIEEVTNDFEDTENLVDAALENNDDFEKADLVGPQEATPDGHEDDVFPLEAPGESDRPTHPPTDSVDDQATAMDTPSPSPHESDTGSDSSDPASEQGAGDV